MALRILVCGGGVAGNALAFWLAGQGHDVTVLERAPALRTSGLQLDLRGHGVEVLRRMGLEHAFRERAVDEQGWEVVGRDGRRRAYFPVNRSGSGVQNFSTEFEIMRGDLCRLLHEAARRRGAAFVFGAAVESVEQKDKSGVEVLLSDGQKERFDLLVGADGQGSRTRRMMLGLGAAAAKEEDPVIYTGDQIAYCTVPWPAREGEPFTARIYLATGGRAVFLRRHSAHQLQVYLMCWGGRHRDRLDGVPRGDVPAEKAAFADLFRGAGWITDEVLEAVGASDDFYCERLGLVRLDSWHQGRVALVGDAAYCPTANTGMGTTSALVGAYVLAGEIEKHCGSGRGGDGLAAALDGYDQKFRPFMDQVQRGISEGSPARDRLTSSRLGVGLVNLLLAVLSRLRIDLLSGRFLREEIKDWTLPDYEMVGRVGKDSEE